jgi:putative membrane protein
MMWGYAGYGFVWMMLFWVGVAFLIAWAIRGSGQSGSDNRAIEILEERFARGEIDSDELRTRRQLLSGK